MPRPPSPTRRAPACCPLLLASVLLLACNVTDPSDPHARVVLAGRVVDSLGAPLGGVRVDGRGFRGGSCTEGSAVAAGSTVSAPDGAFAVTIGALATAFTGCAELTLQGEATPEVPRRVLGVRFREGGVVDTLRTTAVFRPASQAAARAQ